MLIYRVLKRTVICIDRHGRWSTDRLTENLLLDQRQYEGMEEDMMVFYVRSAYLYVPKNCVERM